MSNKTPAYKIKYKQSKKGKVAEARYRENNRIKLRQRGKEWGENNPERLKQMQYKARVKKYMKNPNYCTICHSLIPYGSKQHTPYKFCSNKCELVGRKNDQKRLRKKQYEIYNKYKTDCGCAICGYNKYAGSLDFHHVNPKDRKFRVAASKFYGMTEETIKEIYKCILLCKNCHYEIHGKGDVSDD